MWNTPSGENWLLIHLNLIFSVITYWLTISLIPKFKRRFIQKNLFGFDLHKVKGPKIPEAFGFIVGLTYLVTLFIFSAIAFRQSILRDHNCPQKEFVESVAGLLCISCMLMFGFADDVLDIPWRYKLLLPSIASLPLLMVYYVNFNSTTVILPKFLRSTFGLSVNLGIFYYVYMGMLAVFCSNAINILAGINGLEAGQSLIIALSVCLFNIIEMFGEFWQPHQFSLFFMIPFVSVTLALLKFNWCPAEVFVGDTYCYFAGMTLAVVGILGHFSKTLLLFFIPQIFNFLYSVPQLFHFMPCPRHRMPALNEEKLLVASKVAFAKSELTLLGKFCIKILKIVKLLDSRESKDIMECNNLTLLNLVLIYSGPVREASLTKILLLIQVLCSCIAFTIRYPLASVFYGA
ncbi:unnamed protein product [Bemisia tabaci]|uniref:UDP-N-acetylglucosamine--dolichyl-phosphate N-acetylglucosaminephosphotransferase n=1 Tax=Bemisia tabaci TaxID=7038 RepID=A0A9P0AD52_BEMTA|nr:unnamed protein product [Bemisia tabaci]